MVRPRTFDKEEALEKILFLIWTHGSAGLSLDEIAKRLKLSKTSLYSAFGNKEALLSSCLELYEKKYEQPMLESFCGEKISDCVTNFLSFSSKRFESSDSPPGCFMFNCAVEAEALPEGYRAKVKQYNLAFREQLKQRVLQKCSPAEAGEIESLLEMLLVNLFGMASASRMNFPLSGAHLALLDKHFTS